MLSRRSNAPADGGGRAYKIKEKQDMKLKEYITPEIEIVPVKTENALLAGSPGVDTGDGTVGEFDPSKPSYIKKKKAYIEDLSGDDEEENEW